MVGLAKNDYWYNWVAGKATIDNVTPSFDDEPDTLKVAAVLFDGEKYAQLKNIKIPKMDWSNPDNEWAAAAIGLDVTGNGSSYDLAKCTGGFRYSYKGNSHRFLITFKKDGKAVDYIKDFNSAGDWTTVTMAPSTITRDPGDELNCYGNTPCATTEIIPLNLSNIKQINWRVLPSDSTAITGFLQMKDFDCLVN